MHLRGPLCCPTQPSLGPSSAELWFSLHSQFSQPYSSQLIYPFSMFCEFPFCFPAQSWAPCSSTPDSCLSHLLDFPCFGMSLAIKWGLLASFADRGSLPQDPARHISHKSSSVLLKPRPIIPLFTSLLQGRWTHHLTAATARTTIRLHLSNNSSLFLNGPAEHLYQLALLTSAKTCVQTLQKCPAWLAPSPIALLADTEVIRDRHEN